MAGMEKKQLVEQHLSLVQAIARKVKKTIGRSIELDDLIAYGSKGLVEAAERYDARPGVAFSTFAYYRIRGAMFDDVWFDLALLGGMGILLFLICALRFRKRMG